MLRFDGYEIPVCVALEGGNEHKTIIHEMTHFRNSKVGMNHYSQGGGTNAYEQVTYDDLQEEILAFFSEGIGRADIQIATGHDQRYHFYRRLEDTNEETYQQFMKDTNFFINIAREVKELRPESYLYDLALIPLKKWRRYARYLQEQAKKTS